MKKSEIEVGKTYIYKRGGVYQPILVEVTGFRGYGASTKVCIKPVGIFWGGKLIQSATRWIPKDCPLGQISEQMEAIEFAAESVRKVEREKKAREAAKAAQEARTARRAAITKQVTEQVAALGIPVGYIAVKFTYGEEYEVVIKGSALESMAVAA